MATAAFSYYGSKWKLAPWVISHLPPHENYVEPFAGSLAVLLQKDPARRECVNDLDGEVVNFWRVLRDHGDTLVSRLQLTPYSRDDYVNACEVDLTAGEVERARRFFLRANMGFSGIVAPGMVGYSAGHPGKASKPNTLIKKVENLPIISQRMRSVEIENTDAVRLIDRWDVPCSVIYLDPPYLLDTRRANGGYTLDNSGTVFHSNMVNRLLECKARVVLSGYDHPVYGPLREKGWRVVQKEVYASTSSFSEGAESKRIETLYMNF